jgi:iron complex transport system substrate-binding protein
MSIAWALAVALLTTPARGLAEPPAAAGENPPERIVSLTPSVTETLFALGIGARLVGVSDYCDFPPAAAVLPRVGTFLQPVIEQVIHLQPDLVLTSPSPGNKNAVQAIERAGCRVAVVSEGSGSIEDVRESIRQTAAAVGRGEQGAVLVGAIERALDGVRRKVEGRGRPSTIVVIGFEPLVLAGPASYLGELVDIAGGANIAAVQGGKWPRVGWEFLLASAPEVILDLTAAMDGGEATARARWSRFSDIPAVASGRVVVRADQALLRPGPRLGEAAEIIARAIHPEAWTPSD